MRKYLMFGVGLLLLLVGLGIFFYPSIKSRQMSQEADEVVMEYKTQRDEILNELEKDDPEPENPTKEQSSDGQTQVLVDDSEEKARIAELKKTYKPELYQSLVQYNQDLLTNGQSIHDAWDYEQAPIDLSGNDGSSIIGSIEIPDMKVNLPLYLGASQEHLGKGAAVMSQTSMPIGGESTNCGISAHRGYRGSAFFQYIDRMNLGSLIYIHNPWETLVYKVVDIKIVQPTDSDAVSIQKGRDLVTLISCHPYVVGGGPERYLVIAERVELQKYVTVDVDGDDLPGRLDEDNKVVDPDSYADETFTDEYEKGTVNISTGSQLETYEVYLRYALPVLIILILAIVIGRRVWEKKHKSDKHDLFS